MPPAERKWNFNAAASHFVFYFIFFLKYKVVRRSVRTSYNHVITVMKCLLCLFI